MFFLSFVSMRGWGGGGLGSPRSVLWRFRSCIYLFCLLGDVFVLFFFFFFFFLGGGEDLREPLICVVALPYNIYLFSVLWRQVFLLLSIFRPSLSCHLLLRYLFCLVLGGRFTQVLLYHLIVTLCNEDFFLSQWD